MSMATNKRGHTRASAGSGPPRPCGYTAAAAHRPRTRAGLCGALAERVFEQREARTESVLAKIAKRPKRFAGSARSRGRRPARIRAGWPGAGPDPPEPLTVRVVPWLGPSTHHRRGFLHRSAPSAVRGWHRTTHEKRRARSRRAWLAVTGYNTTRPSKAAHRRESAAAGSRSDGQRLGCRR